MNLKSFISTHVIFLTHSTGILHHILNNETWLSYTYIAIHKHIEGLFRSRVNAKTCKRKMAAVNAKKP
jgi:hypothetical protein